MRQWVKREHKRLFHFAMLAVVAGDFFFTGASLADLSFLALAVFVEVGL